MSLKIENSRRVAKSLPVCMDLKSAFKDEHLQIRTMHRLAKTTNRLVLSDTFRIRDHQFIACSKNQSVFMVKL